MADQLNVRRYALNLHFGGLDEALESLIWDG
jgi:hypothetical protein